MSKDEEYKTMNIPLSGKLVTALDGTQLQEGDFQILKNMRYTDVSIKSVSGMTNINTSIMNATYYRPRAGFQFRAFRPLAITPTIASGTGGGGVDPIITPPYSGSYTLWDWDNHLPETTTYTIASGVTIAYGFTLPSSTYTRLAMLVYGVSLEVVLNCTAYLPTTTVQQEVRYALRSDMFQWRSQLYGVQPNIPENYIPGGLYILEIVCTSSGSYQLKLQRS